MGFVFEFGSKNDVKFIVGGKYDVFIKFVNQAFYIEVECSQVFFCYVFGVFFDQELVQIGDVESSGEYKYGCVSGC